MSSLRNAVQRRNHRERAQPTERAKWGLLEKRKDYKLRAADHKTKQKKIAALKQKASERNDDEFYFSMVNSSTVGGIKRSKRGEENSGGAGKSLDVEVVKLMKTQDQGYLQTMLNKCKRERERLEREVVAGEVGVIVSKTSTSWRIVFDEDGQEMLSARPTSEDDEEDFDMDLDNLIDGVNNEDDDKDESEAENLTPQELAMKRRKRHNLQAKQRRLAALKEQEEKLAIALGEVDHNRAQMAGTVGGVNKNGTKFKQRTRKR